MSNFSENEKNTQASENGEVVSVSENDSFSTVFSDPGEHYKKPLSKKKKPRLLIAIVSLLVVAALVGGTVAIVKLIPESTDNTSSSVFEDISVLSLKSDDFKTVKVKNSKGEFTLYSKVEKTETESDDTSSEDTTYTSWYIEGYGEDVFNSYSVSAIAESAANIVAVREITTKTAEDCGLTEPKIKVDVVTNDGAEFSILVGNKSTDNLGDYLKLSTSDKIYVVSSSATESFEFDLLNLANTESIPGVTPTSDMSEYLEEDGDLCSFDTITVSGKYFASDVVIAPNEDKELKQYVGYVTLAPTKRIAENVDSIFEVFQYGITASGAYALDASAASISACGLNNPDLTLIMKIKNVAYTFKFKLQEDGGYAVWYDNCTLIKKVDASSIAFVNYNINSFYSSNICLISINDISNFSVKTPSNEYSFDIKTEKNENDSTKYIVNCGGKELVAQNFQNFYQYCVALSCTDFTVENLTASPDLTLTFTYNDTAKGKYIVEFRKASETKYQFSVNGVEMGKITSSAFNKLEKYAKKVAEGGSIN